MSLPLRNDQALSEASAINNISDLPPLPSEVRSLDGQIIDTSSNVWVMRVSIDGGKIIRLDWERFETGTQPSMLSYRTLYLVKLFILDEIKRKKTSTVSNTFGAILRFDQWLSISGISIISSQKSESFNWSHYNEDISRMFLTYGIENSAGRGNDFSRLRTLYTWGIARQYTDFDPSVLRILKKIEAVGNDKGHNVRFRHPTKGPFFPDEQLLITRAITTNVGTDQDRAIVMLHLELGPNPNALARLKNADLKRYDSPTGVTYQIDLPRIKKRIDHRETKRRPISQQLGQLLETLIRGEPESYLLHWLDEDDPEHGMRIAMRRFVREGNIISPVTKEILSMTPRRFRYTLATHMAEEGASRFDIAEILDHSDLQHVGVYTQTVSSISDHIAKAIDPIVEPLVRRFLGDVIDEIDTPAFESLPNQVIPAASPHLPFPLLNAGGVGVCGRNIRTDGLCRLFPPLSCYMCDQFAALRTGPHKEMLDAIDEYIRDGQDILSPRILQQLDMIRTAIQEVLARVEGTQPLQ